jgi:ribosome biogenesis protein Nip4
MTVNYGKDKSLVTRRMKSALPMELHQQIGGGKWKKNGQRIHVSKHRALYKVWNENVFITTRNRLVCVMGGRSLGGERIKKRKKQIFNTHKRASGMARNLWGRARANNGTGSGGGTRRHRMRNKNLIITIT